MFNTQRKKKKITGWNQAWGSSVNQTRDFVYKKGDGLFFKYIFQYKLYQIKFDKDTEEETTARQHFDIFALLL